MAPPPPERWAGHDAVFCPALREDLTGPASDVRRPPPPPLKLADVQPPPPTEQKPDLFIPILVGVSFGGYGLIILYDVFFGNGLCGLTVDCANTPFSW